MIRTALLALSVLLVACSASPGSAPPAAGAGSSEPEAAGGGPAAPSEMPHDDGVPERFQGLWARHQDACATPAHESKLTLDARRIGFHESEGPVTRATVDGDMLTVVATLSGEGESREATHHFRLAPDGNSLTALEGGLVRVRCPP